MRLQIVIGLWILASAATGGENLLQNGNFSDGLKGWKTTFPEANETKYALNHKNVQLVDAPNDKGGKAVEFNSTGRTAASEGVKVVSRLIRIDSMKSYIFGVDVLRLGPGCKVFLEGYVENPEQTVNGNDQYSGFVRCYRASIHVKAKKGKWARKTRTINLAKVPKRSRPTHVLLKLYCYYPPGKVYYTNAFLRETEAAK